MGVKIPRSGQAKELRRSPAQNQVRVLLGEAGFADVINTELVDRSRFVREIASEHKAIRAESFDGQLEGWNFAVIYGVIPHPASGNARLLRHLGILPSGYAIHAIEQHGQRAADVRGDDLHIRIMQRNAGGDQVCHGNGIFDRSTDQPDGMIV